MPEPEPIDAEAITEDEQPKSVQVVRQQQRIPAEYEKALEPTDANMAYKMAHQLFESRLFGTYPNAQAVFAIIMAGRARGIDAVTSLQTYHIIKGRPFPKAELIVAWAKNHPKCSYFYCVESTAEAATWETQHESAPNPSARRTR